MIDERIAPLVELGLALEEAGYAFVTGTPETHRRVNARAGKDPVARSLRDVFGWSRPFSEDLLPRPIAELARRANVIVPAGAGRFTSKVRFSTLRGRLYVHSAYPTLDAEAVFFGPDTYRFCDLVAAELESGFAPSFGVDVGCGAGSGGIVAAARAKRVVLADINRTALLFAAANAALAGVSHRIETIESDVLDGVHGSPDLVLANPPYLVDPKSRAYRDGGGSFGEELGVRIARDGLRRLAPGGRLILYTGSAVVDGVDTFHRALLPLFEEAAADYRYREIDPDVFGEEIENNDAYAEVERIAAVALVATRR